MLQLLLIESAIGYWICYTLLCQTIVGLFKQWFHDAVCVQLYLVISTIIELSYNSLVLLFNNSSAMLNIHSVYSESSLILPTLPAVRKFENSDTRHLTQDLSSNARLALGLG